ncbi:MAG: hypothetical protein LBL94_02475 [Prevotellaceae bacterium]|jgi:hypothetical protein|nr:hypothetical protein [Prevotellaceae bacterium]
MKRIKYISLLAIAVISSCMKEEITPEPVIAEIEDSEWAQIKEDAL